MGQVASAFTLLVGIVKRFWIWAPSILLDPFDLYNKHFRHLLPEEYGQELNMPSEWFPFVLGVLIFWSAGLAYHEVRKRQPLTAIELAM